ncbi:Cyclic nucleotide-binding domain protein [Planctomycetes bacterium Pan216]|uniref:Cyclic nucleotide-binding domain protein n=1 Tax=Kolteria novifilia TaxID=2527975 RepID=A0A518B419_9BACT|nr:Cyclic nucleotide-binding domain protein [Planctomycetes bacterium Pan216]
MQEAIEHLEISPFFEAMEQPWLERLALHARLVRVGPGKELLRAGDDAESFYMLVSGSVRLCFDQATSGKNEHREVMVRTISEPGRVIGWSALVEPFHYRATARTIEHSELYAWDREWLEQESDRVPEFGLEVMKRILWVLGNRLRETRIRLVAKRYEEEVIAIRALLGDAADQLSVTSPLHKIPYYLENRLTLSDAFHTLEILGERGDHLERNLSGLCLDVLGRVRTELIIYQQLQLIYEIVAQAPETASPAHIRRRCCEEFQRLFAETDYVIEGREHLPDDPGHIFIMNHLDSHPENSLPNDFRLTLDTHFVSAMIVFAKYGEAPIRVVRKSRPDEFGHQQYYDRLGYLYVLAGHVDEDTEHPEVMAEQRRRHFFDAARSCLLEGQNLVICPEGGNASTEDSPKPFRAGAFRLAAMVRPEPLIVPVAVANFDAKLTRTRLAAVVKRPFRLSEILANPNDNASLYAFVNGYRERFRGYVQEARSLAAVR